MQLTKPNQNPKNKEEAKKWARTTEGQVGLKHGPRASCVQQQQDMDMSLAGRQEAQSEWPGAMLQGI